MKTTRGVIVGVLLCALGVVWTAVNVRQAYDRAIQTTTIPVARIADWRSYTTGGHRQGPASALVTVVVLSDYECGYCAALNRRLAALRSKHPAVLATVLYHYPLPGHRAAVAAARAAICAGRQHRFDAVHEQLFAWTDSLGKASWVTLAGIARVNDLELFRTCVHGEESAEVLREHLVRGQRLRASVTPTILINDAMYEGLPPDLEKLVEQAIEAHSERTRG